MKEHISLDSLHTHTQSFLLQTIQVLLMHSRGQVQVGFFTDGFDCCLLSSLCDNCLEHGGASSV